MEPEPPPITVVDPRLPGSTDLLLRGDDREPWRPTPRQKRVALAAAAVIAVVAGASYAADRARAGRRADRAALSTVRLWTDSLADGPGPAGSIPLSLRNDGPSPVRVLAARLLAPGYDELALDDLVQPGESLAFDVTDAAPCGPQLVDEPAEAIRVRVRTHRGQITTRDVPLGPAAFTAVNHPARERCGYLGADESFAFEVESLELRGRAVVAHATVHDDSVLPLELRRVVAIPGLAVDVSPTTPLRLPPQTGTTDRVMHFVPLTLRLRVVDCSAFFSGPAFGLDRLVHGWVVRGDSIFEVPIPLVTPDSREQPVPIALIRLLVRSCGADSLAR